jgi:serine/threonine protein kinase
MSNTTSNNSYSLSSSSAVADDKSSKNEEMNMNSVVSLLARIELKDSEHRNNRKYLSKDEFLKRYTLDREISSGQYGRVYSVRNEPNVVVKKGTFLDLLRDIDILSQIEHPNIIPILDICVDINDTTYIATPRGTDFLTYIESNPTENKRLMYELACGLSFLHEVGIVHGDIKPQNIVMLGDSPVFIDFGISRVCIPDNDKKIFYGRTYTFAYREPEYIDINYNPLDGDVFSLGKVFEYIKLGENYWPSLPMGTSDSLLYDLFTKMLDVRARRLTSKQVLKHPFFDDLIKRSSHQVSNSSPITVTSLCNPGVRYVTEVPIKNSKTLYDINDKMYYILVNWLMDIACYPNFNLQLRTFFLAVHNIHRSIGVMKKYTRKDFQTFGCVNLFLAQNEFEFETPDIVNYITISSGLFNKESFYQMAGDVLNELGGIIYTTTYWDLCDNVSDLPDLLEDTLDWNYTLQVKARSPLVISSLDDKIVSCNPFLLEWRTKRHLSINLYQTFFHNKHRGLFFPPIQVTMTKLNLHNVDYNTLLTQFNYKNFNPENAFGYIYALRGKMQMEPDFANQVLTVLVNYKPKVFTEPYDVIFGSRKLNVLRGKDLTKFKINTYTASLAEILADEESRRKKIFPITLGTSTTSNESNINTNTNTTSIIAQLPVFPTIFPNNSTMTISSQVSNNLGLTINNSSSTTSSSTSTYKKPQTSLSAEQMAIIKSLLN